MTWGEAVRLSRLLLTDPGSWVYASVAGWDRPWSLQDEAQAATLDLLRRVHARNPAQVKPFPRPWPNEEKVRMGASTPLDQDQVRDALRAVRPATAA